MDVQSVIGRLAAILALLVGAGAALADVPLVPAPATTCSLGDSACALRTADGHTAVIWRRGAHGARLDVWRAAIVSPRLLVADDGRSLVELYPGLNLLDGAAGAATVVLVFHRPGSRPMPIRLGDVIDQPSRLPATASHRQWARTYRYDGRGSFVLMTAKRRSIRFDPATGEVRRAVAR